MITSKLPFFKQEQELAMVRTNLASYKNFKLAKKSCKESTKAHKIKCTNVSYKTCHKIEKLELVYIEILKKNLSFCIEYQH